MPNPACQGIAAQIRASLVKVGGEALAEAIFQERHGHPISHVGIPAEQNSRVVYSAALVPVPPHPEAARAWLAFIGTDAAFAALAPFGFQRVR